MGFDLHTHSMEHKCDGSCLAKRGGRRAQLDAQMSLLRSRDGFFALKRIDGQPTVNGSQLIMAMRLGHFMYRRLERQTYYESIADPAEVRHQVLWGGQLQQIGVPLAQVDQHLIVVEAFRSWYSAPRGKIGMPAPGDVSIGLHCVFLTGYSDGGAIFHFVNSWGPAWGDNGKGTISYECFEEYFYEAFVVRKARFGPSLPKFLNAAAPMDPAEFRRKLLVQNPRQTIRDRRAPNANWRIELYLTMSPTTEEQVLCVEVQNGFGLRLGWAFFRYSRSSNHAVLEVPELFVWPIFRRIGVARTLEQLATDYAELWGCSEIHLMMNEADAVVGPPRAAARQFAEALGYRWKWRQDVAPRRTATAIKRLSPLPG